MSTLKGPNGIAVRVTDRGELRTTSISRLLIQDLNGMGKLFSSQLTETPTGAGDYFMYFKNIGLNDVVLDRFFVSSTVITDISLDVVTGIPPSGTTPTVVNLNLGSSRVPEIIALHDPSLTGLIGIGTIRTIKISEADTDFEVVFNTAIIIPQGKSIALKRLGASGSISLNATVGELN